MLQKIGEQLSVRIGGNLHSCDPWTLHKRIAEQETPEGKRRCLIDAFGIPPEIALNENKSLLIISHLLDYLRQINEIYRRLETTAELLAARTRCGPFMSTLGR